MERIHERSSIIKHTPKTHLNTDSHQDIGLPLHWLVRFRSRVHQSDELVENSLLHNILLVRFPSSRLFTFFQALLDLQKMILDKDAR